MDDARGSDDGADIADDEKGPERTCVVTRRKGDPATLIRFVVGPDGNVVPDIRNRLPGRGAWVTASKAVLEQAIKRKAFARAFKRDVGVAPDLTGQVDTLLERDALQSLALANKAGQVVAGAAKVEAAIERRTLVGLIHAADGRADGIRKTEAVARRTWPDGGDEMARVQFFVSSQLDLALGRSNVIHVGLLEGGVSEAFLERAARLGHFRGASPERPIEAADSATSDDAALNET